MKMSMLSLFVSFTLSFSYGQTACEIDKISAKNRSLLQDFCLKFTKAVQLKNKQQLAGLFKFPFNCASCDDSTQTDYAPFFIVTKQSFLAFQYKNFIVPNLIEEVTKNKLFNMLMVENGSKKYPCSYEFSYPLIKPTKKFEGAQCFLTITKVGGRYKIIAAWTVP